MLFICLFRLIDLKNKTHGRRTMSLFFFSLLLVIDPNDTEDFVHSHREEITSPFSLLTFVSRSDFDTADIIYSFPVFFVFV